MKILILRGGALGDLLLTLPVLDEIRSNLPRSFIEVWGVQPQASLIQSANRVDRLDALDVAPLFIAEPIPPVLRGRLREFDLAISFLADPGGVVAQNLASAGVQKVVKGSPAKEPTIHAVYQLASVLEPLGLNLRDPVPKLKIDRSQSQKPLLGFHPGSGSTAKNWPLECWNGFLQRIASKFERLLLIGGEADDEVIRAIQLSWKGPAFETAIRRNLWELARTLSRCRIFVGHDTGVTHLAAAVQTPTVALFGPTNPEVWRPLGEHVKIIRGEGGKIDTIGLETVLDVVNAFTRT
ncbi:MAG TPA: glycosyltransferase family 9 protein [Chthoniobacterales bacterium]|nr:glycosyltransferase family 9 protein [Chthoniobacterales bacterium]